MPTAGHGRVAGATPSVIEINTKEIALLGEFVRDHEQLHPANSSDWPHRFKLAATPNGVASSVVVTCQACHATADISDVTSW